MDIRERRFLQLVPLVFLVAVVSCVRQISPPIRQANPILVVEGLLTTDPAPYSVKLSYSGNFTNASSSIDSNQQFINDAVVVIRDNLGDSTLCIPLGEGNYQSQDSSFIGAVGRSYTLVIHLSNGKTYISGSQEVTAVPPIDSVTVQYDSSYVADVRPTQFIVSINSRDPISQTNYYRWTALGYLPRKSWGGPCDSFTDPPCTTPFDCLCYAQCEQLQTDNQINVLSDALVNGNEIIQPVYYSPIYWFGNHFIEIKQYSISQDIYVFWKQYIQQTALTGSILDPLPAPLLGNIHNVADSNDLALGYFEASAVSSVKIIIEPLFLQQYFLESVAGEYVPHGDCHLVFPNSLPDDTDPDGWENAELIQVH